MELVLTITDVDEKPIQAATVDVSAKHTDMSGMDMGGTASYQGSGRYSVKANFSMISNWKLTVSVRKDGLDYKEEIDLLIQQKNTGVSRVRIMNERLKYSAVSLRVLLNMFELFGTDEASEEVLTSRAPIAM